MLNFLRRWRRHREQPVFTSAARVQEPVGRELVRWVQFGVCPDCGATDQWQEGPSGGSCTNFRCDGCGAKFNVALPPLNLIQRIG